MANAWAEARRGFWKHREHITLLEARTLVKTIRELAHQTFGHDIRQLFLVDNMSVALAFSRSRAHDFALLVQIRRFCAYAIARGIVCYIRWIPSELNDSDAPSRNYQQSSETFTTQLEAMHVPYDPAPTQLVQWERRRWGHGARAKPAAHAGECGQAEILGEDGGGAQETSSLHRVYCGNEGGAGWRDASNTSDGKPLIGISTLGGDPAAPAHILTGNCSGATRSSRRARGVQRQGHGLIVDLERQLIRGRGRASDKKGEKLKKRAKRRRTKYTAAAEEAALDGRGFLESVAVTPKVQKTHEEELSRWRAYLASMGLRANTVAKMDSSIKSFFDLSFFDGIEPSHGEKFLAGVMDKAPEFGKMGALQLPRSWRALRAWKRLTPPRSRKGKPWAVWCAVGWRLNAQGHLDMAIFLLELVTGYYRPSELQRIRKKD